MNSSVSSGGRVLSNRETGRWGPVVLPHSDCFYKRLGPPPWRPLKISKDPTKDREAQKGTGSGLRGSSSRSRDAAVMDSCDFITRRGNATGRQLLLYPNRNGATK